MDTPQSFHEDLVLPYRGVVGAGFQSPAQDYVETSVNLSKLLLRRKAASFFVSVQGISMAPNINDGDYLLVDNSIRPGHGDIVIADVEGAITVKRLYKRDQFVSLQPDNTDFSPIFLDSENSADIWGVVTAIIRIACLR